MIINTLLRLKNEGRAETTIKSYNYSLKQLSNHADLTNPESVKTYLANATTLKTNSKYKHAIAYLQFSRTNNINFQMPKYKIAENIPIIPTKETVTAIITASSTRYATIFTILAETGIEPQELYNITRKNIDIGQGVISVTGTKQHDSGTYKLKKTTAEMLTEYLTINPQEHPFPKPKTLSQTWRNARNRASNNLKQPQLKNIPVKSLRNYSGAQLYYKTLANGMGDPIAVMRHLRHKKIEQTMHYIRAIVLDNPEEEEYITRTATTPQEICGLIEAGYTKADQIDGIHIYKKRK